MVMALVASPPGALGQEAAPLGDLSIEDLLDLEVDTVVGASKYRQRVSEAPASVTIVTAEDIRRQHYRSIADVLRSVRGFYVTYDRNYHYVGTRGFVRPGDYNSRILVLVDGHRLNDNVFGGALIGQEFPVDVSLIDRVEVIRGPGSALYGSSALFGVVNVITRQPAQAPGTTASLLGAGQATGGATVSHARVRPGGSSFLASASVYRSGGGRDLFFPEFLETPSGGHAIGRDATRRVNGLFNVTAGPVGIQAVYGLREKHVPTGAFGAVFDHPDTRTLDGQGFVDFTYARAWRRGYEVSSRVFLDHYQYSGVTPYDGDDGVVLNYDRARGVWWGGELRLAKTVASRHRLTAGVELRDNVRQYQRNYDAAPYVEYLRDERDSDIWSAFVEDEWRVAEGLRLHGGVRADAYREFPTAVKPRVGLILTPRRQTTVKLLYGEAFRAPTVYELYWRQADVTKGNPDLRHEDMRNTEVAVEQAVGSRWRVSANAFHYRLRRLVDQVLDDDGLLVYRNRGAVNGSGIEAEIEGHWDGGVQFRVSQTVQRSRSLLMDGPLSNSPRAVFQAAATVPLTPGGLSVSTNLQALSRRRTLSGGDASPYAVLNLSVAAPPLRGRLTVEFSLWNVFDTRYGDPGSEEHRQALIPQDGRVAGLHARVRF